MKILSNFGLSSVTPESNSKFLSHCEQNESLPVISFLKNNKLLEILLKMNEIINYFIKTDRIFAEGIELSLELEEQ